MNTKLAILWIMLFAIVRNQCAANVNLDNTESAIITAQVGSNQLNLKNGSSPILYTYSLKRPMSSPPQVAFAIISFDASPITGFSFALQVGQTNQNLIQVVLSTPWNVTVWRSLKVNLLANGRSDTQLGVSSFKSTLPFYSDAFSAQDQVTIQFQKSLPSTSGYIARPFLSGVTLTQITNAISISLSGGNVTTNGFAVNVTSASAPSALTVSYMLFSPSTAGYASYGGIIDQPLVPNSTYISVFKSLSSLQNYIYGINGFAFGSAPNINISTSIDKSFVLAIQPGQIVTNLTVAYIIYGMSPKYVCLNCPNTLPNFDGNCASQPTAQEATYTYPDGSQGYIVCSNLANLVLSADGKSCVCNTGTTLVRGICTNVQPYQTATTIIPGGSTQSTSTTTSSTQSSQYSQSGAPLKPIFGDSTSTTSSTSNSGSSSSGFIVSQPKVVNYTSQTTSTTQPLTAAPISTSTTGDPSSSTNTTTNLPGNCNTTLNSYWNGAACVCFPGFTNSSGQCTNQTLNSTGSFPSTASPLSTGPSTTTTQSTQTTSNSVAPGNCNMIPNTYWNGVACVCLPGFTNLTGQCQNGANTPGSVVIQPSQSNGNCSSISNSYWNGAVCSCLPGYYNVSGACNQCANGFYWNGAACTSLNGNSPTNPTISVPGGISTTQPIITPGFNQPTTSYPVGTTTIYPTATSYPGGSGYPNIPGSISSPPTTTVIPNFGQNNPSYPNLNPIVCPANRYPLANICVCLPIYYQSPYGDCVKINNTDPYDPSGPTVNCGTNGRYDLRKRACVCNQGYYWTGNGCAPGNVCPDNSTRINATQCVCNAPLIMVNNICSRCYPSGFWDGSNCIYLCGVFSTYNPTLQRCVCNNGYGRIDPNTCAACPSNSKTINETCAVCPANSQLIGQTCICNDGYRLASQGYCVSTCPLGSVYVPNTGRCRCLQQNFYLNNNQCVACPINSYSDGYTCTACPSNSVVNGSSCICRNSSLVFDVPTGLCIACPFNSFIVNNICVSCPINSTFSPDQNVCSCNPGYIRQGPLCINACPNGIYIGGSICAYCPLNSLPRNNICVCSLGYTRLVNNGPCLKACTGGTFLLPNGTCAACPINQGYNQRSGQCECLAGFSFNVDRLCVRACPYGSTLVPATNDCQCNQRYYFQNGVCLSCPQTCLTCTSSTVCVTCVPGYNLVGTQCVATNPVNPACLPAQFRAIPNGPCLNCPGFCITCNAANTCSQCATGFSWNATVATCTEICGDGIRFAQQCDDGNTISGDGCSSTCTIEPGWICMKNPANPTGPDYCVRPNNPTTTLYIRQFGPVQTSVSKATFQIQVATDAAYTKSVTDYINSTIPLAIQIKNSEAMITFTFVGLQADTQAKCDQNLPSQPVRWTCTISYANQLSKTSYTATLSARTPSGLTATLVVPVQAVTPGSINALRN